MKTRSILSVSAAFTLASLLATSTALGSEATGRVGEFIGDSNFTTNVFELSLKAGAKGAAQDQPWSGSYWPLHAGSIGNPYNEDGGSWLNNTTRKLKSVKANARHFEKRMADIRKNLNHLSQETINEMAPSEKYDLYIGDYDFNLTFSVWQSLMEQFRYVGKLALWEGSCQGWATASSNVPRPKTMIQVMSLDGKYLIPFYPDDLKALATLLWANSLVQDHTVLLGNRCKTRNPEFDESNGKVLTDTCQGVNPSDLHVILLELMGARKETFIVNRVNNTQVWNQPAANYEMTYFNLITGKEGEITDSMVSLAQYPDPFKDYRSKKATSAVGVHLKLRYSSERNPSHRKKDEAKEDKIKTLDLHYDLELNENHQIVGGEWISSEAKDGVDSNEDDEDEEGVEPPEYPGFIWKFSSAKPNAYSIADFDLQGNDPTQMNRAALIQASKKASQFRYKVFKSGRMELRPQPLSKVVNSLVQMSVDAP